MKTTNLLTEWVINKIKTEYKNDIALLIAVRGHATDNDGHGEVFDYFIPTTERGYELSQTFIIDGVGHDLYPRSWERVEKSVFLDEMTMVLANAEILYARSKEDADRFLSLQDQLKKNLSDDIFVYRKALERLESAMDIFRTLMFEEKSCRARSEACCIHLYLSQAVAYMNHTFTDSPVFSEKQAYNDDPQSSCYHCPGLIYVPDSFFASARRLLQTGNIKEIREIMHTLILSVKSFVLERKPEIKTEKKEPDFKEFAGWYQELSLTFRRIRFFCRENMVEEAYKDACYLQNELLVIAPEFQIEELNLLDSFSADSLVYLNLRSQKLEQDIRRVIQNHGIEINEYSSITEFLAANPIVK